ncbi:restriction endonuclease subunit S [Alishewanella jeotgali]|uniref:Restriction modification system DNA specificity subunit n=1 Tax=Alishewanella jeotgali KCTC 22429 TaxID=1129374 RepID=H3Z9T7_9ALTE|nr:restriction endonuclease subunit S [Alishewanella jeotgali]EHR42611.1 restriction modification system DNA specificity subunit [Alishewanella jeotgali KCTC 22429]
MSWPMVKLGDLVSIKGGGTPSKSDSSFWGGDIPWASVKDLKGSRISVTEDTINDLGVKNSATNIIPAGTIITATRMALGRFAINTVDMAINQDLKALFVNDHTEISSDYLFRFLESKAQYIEGEGKGATVKGITLDFLKSIDVPLPPLAEQKRIAAILDKADAIRRKRQQAIQLADDFLRAVFLEMFGDPVTNPKGWGVKTLGEITTFENGDRSSNYPSGDEIVQSGVLFLSTKNIVADALDLRTKQFITEEKYNSLSRGKAQKGDLIITLRGTLGACCIFDCAYDKAFINAQMMIIRPTKQVVVGFLHDFLVSGTMKSHFQRIGQGAAVPQLTAKQFKELLIPLPTLELQFKYDKIRSFVISTIEKLSGAEDEKLFNSLSQKAFFGQL